MTATDDRVLRCVALETDRHPDTASEMVVTGTLGQESLVTSATGIDDRIARIVSEAPPLTADALKLLTASGLCPALCVREQGPVGEPVTP